VGLAVVFAAFVFFVFVAFVFFVFVALVVSCVVSCANTGIASEKTIMLVNNIVRSFFMLGLDLLRNYFLFGFEQCRGHNAIICVGDRQIDDI
jgi:integral membrane sensor domain MASE1